MSKLLNGSGVAVLLVVATVGLALAHSGAKGVVKQRMDMMTEIGKSMKVIGTMLKNQEMDLKQIRIAALDIQTHAGNMLDLFPAGSIETPSESLPAIWTNWNEFQSLAKDLDQAANRLATMAETSAGIEEINVQFKIVGETCSGCHKKFRLKK